MIVFASLLYAAGSARGVIEVAFLTGSADEGADNTLSLEISNPTYSPSWYMFVLHGVLVHFDWMVANENASANPDQFPVTLEWGDSISCDVTFLVPRGIANETYHNYTLILELMTNHVDGTWSDLEETRFNSSIFIRHTEPAEPSESPDLTTPVTFASGVIVAVLAIAVLIMLRKRKGGPAATSVPKEESAPGTL